MNSASSTSLSWTDAQLADITLLHVPGVGHQIRQRLIEQFGSLEASLLANRAELLQVPGIGSKLVDRWLETVTQFDARGHLDRCQASGIDVRFPGASGYPESLAEIPDPPPVIYQRGTILPQDQLAIAIVGTRRATSYGKRLAARFATTLSRCGFTIVSGLARGIDAVAHEAALAVQGRTLAVLGSGLDCIYPPEHQKLSRQIASSGALVSELRPESRPKSGSFPRRNRIISGLCVAVLVIEAAKRSGALITARHAIEQNREVFAIPGSIEQVSSRGCHDLIRDGAKLVESIDDILDELGPLASTIHQADGTVIKQPRELGLNDQERAVLFAIQDDVVNIDDLARRTRLPVHRVLSTVAVLEAKHLLRRVEGNRVIRR